MESIEMKIEITEAELDLLISAAESAKNHNLVDGCECNEEWSQKEDFICKRCILDKVIYDLYDKF